MLLKRTACLMMSVFLAGSLVPFAGIGPAFAEEAVEEAAEEVVEAPGVIDQDADEPVAEEPSVEEAAEAAEALEPDESKAVDVDIPVDDPEEEGYIPPESFRYEEGELAAAVKGRSIGTHYPESFVTYDEGYHTRSDALRGIDVSYYQGSNQGTSIDWARVKASGINFAIIRSSDGFNFNDPDFARNVRGCMDNGIPFGVYHYARATNASEANAEADHVFRQLAAAGVTPSNISFPIYYDIENSGTPNYWDLGQDVVDSIARTFIGRMNAAGYKSGVYTSTSWYEGGPCGSSYINSLEYRWCAQYNAAGLRYDGFGSDGNGLMNSGKGVWQFTSHGDVDGISGYVDLNYSYYKSLSVSADVTVDRVDGEGGVIRFAVRNINASMALDRLELAVWCDSHGGMDDLRWYEMTSMGDGSYILDVHIKDHKGYEGTYIADPYFISRTGERVGGTGEMRARANMAVAPKSFTYGPESDNAYVRFTGKGGDYAKASAVRAIVWSDKGGQDDIWSHAAQKSGSAWTGTVNLHHHRESGSYALHVYATVNGTERCVETVSFYVASYHDPGIQMHRVYNPNSGEHFYTASAVERDSLVRAGWTYEGIGWTAASGKLPVYRLYSGTDHHYTSSSFERDSLINAGWKDEGIGWYTENPSGIPLYRQFNPNVDPSAPTNNSGSHNYTMSKAENDNLVAQGWRAEGIGWYGL